MKTQPISPARIVFDTLEDGSAGPPQAPDFGDVYHPRIGAAAQARHVFLGGNGLPARWAGRARFVVLETGFGLGNNFIATWQAWRDDAARCEQLFYVAIERHPPALADLRRAHAASPARELSAELLAAWPAAVANLHPLHFDNGQVQLLLAWGDVAAMLPALRLQADACYLDGFAPARNPAMWEARVLKTVGRRAAVGATLATWSVARELHAGLRTAGFEVQMARGIGGKREITHARRTDVHVREERLPDGAQPQARSAIVIGAGLAGAAAAQALAQLGLQVTVIERQSAPAMQASGNPAGLFHGTLDADDSPYARLFRAASLYAARDFAAKLAQAPQAGSVAGLLRVAPEAGGVAAMQALLQRLGLPPDYVQALDATAAAALAGVPLPSAAWFYPQAGWFSPPTWVRMALDSPRIALRCGRAAAALERSGADWVVRDEGGTEIARSPLVVVACTASAPRLLQAWQQDDAGAWPLRATQGQVTQAQLQTQPLCLPVAGDGYAIPLPDGTLLCGATRTAADWQALDQPVQTCDAAHALNLQRLKRLTGLQGAAELQGRAGWRLHTDDRLPLAGALPLLQMPAGQRRDQPRLLPREDGLFVLTALGARGLTLAPLLGRLVAAQATGTPWPLEQDLADAVDPARWLVRAARQGGSAATRAAAQAGSLAGNQAG